MIVAPLLALASALVAPPKPIVLATDREPTQADRELMAAPLEERADRVAKGHYDLREFGAFLLAAPHDLLHIEAAKVQGDLMREIAKRASEGARVIELSSLPEAPAKALRDEVRNLAINAEASLADAPDLRLALGVYTTFQATVGGRTLPFTVAPPGVPFGQEDRARMKAPAVPSPKSRGGAGLDPLRPGSGRLTFVASMELDGTKTLEWIAEAQAALLKEAREARTAWAKERDTLLDTIRVGPGSPFKPSAGREPHLSDLDPDYLSSMEQRFGMRSRRDLGDLSGPDWLGRADVGAGHPEPILELHVDLGKDTPNSRPTSVTYIPFVCPVGP